MAGTLISVGLVTWNSAAHLSACLAALAGQTEVAFELIVVDNASTDESINLIRACWPVAQFICNSTNTGFAGAHNQAIRASTGTYYLPLNPDVIMRPGYLATLVEALEARPAYGMAGGKLLQNSAGNGPLQLDSTGLFIDRRRRQYLRGHGEIDQTQYDQNLEVFGVDGAAPLYRRRMLEDVCLEGEYFDEIFFAYKEDVDLAWRARWLGWPAWYVPGARAVHARSFRPGTRGGGAFTRYYSVRNRYLLLMKNETLAGWKRDWGPILFYDLQILGYLLLRERDSLRAVRDAFRLQPVMQSKQAALQRKARISAGDLLHWFR